MHAIYIFNAIFLRLRLVTSRLANSLKACIYYCRQWFETLGRMHSFIEEKKTGNIV